MLDRFFGAAAAGAALPPRHESEGHPAPLSPADLAGHNCLRYPYAPFADGWHFLDADGNPVVARISGSLISSSPDTMHAAALAGIGLVMTVPLLIRRPAGLGSVGAAVARLPDAGAGDQRALSPPTAPERQGARVRRHAGRSVRRTTTPVQASDSLAGPQMGQIGGRRGCGESAMRQRASNPARPESLYFKTPRRSMEECRRFLAGRCRNRRASIVVSSSGGDDAAFLQEAMMWSMTIRRFSRGQ